MLLPLTAYRLPLTAYCLLLTAYCLLIGRHRHIERRGFAGAHGDIGHVGPIPVLANLHVVNAGSKLKDEPFVVPGVLPWLTIDRDARVAWLHT